MAYQDEAAVDEAYLHILIQGRGSTTVASHAPVMVAAGASRRPHVRRIRDPDAVRHPGTEQLRLAGARQHPRVYLLYGDQWCGYVMRRLAERTANPAFFLRSLTSKT
ncbi:hypothetical protein [Streptomyces sp. NPDC059176]|uniref:hypothetical protein n=1 Tax=unclassified Streptomyces TaxID=2593676 RepID=UPI003694B208